MISDFTATASRRAQRLPLAVFGVVLVSFFACARVGDRATESSTTRPDASAESRLTETRTGPVIVFLGNSLTAGYGLGVDQAFPAHLERDLHEGFGDIRVINAGVSGDTSAGGLRRIDWLLRQKPDVVVVELGANDGLRGLPLEHTESNLREIAERARTAGSRVLLLGMKVPPNYGPEYGGGFVALFERLADELDLAFVPFFLEGVAGEPELNLADGIHPTAEGHRILAANIRPALHELLQELD